MSTSWARLLLVLVSVALMVIPSGIVSQTSAMEKPSATGPHPGTTARPQAAVRPPPSQSVPLAQAERSLERGGGPAHGHPVQCKGSGGSAQCQAPHSPTQISTAPGAVGWREVTPTVPSPRRDEVLVDDPADNVTLLFGGITPQGVYLSDTWLLTWGTGQWGCYSFCQIPDTTMPQGVWQQLTGVSGPSARANASATFDYADNEVVLFGGMGPGGVALGDTWTYRAGNWTELNTSQSPSPRYAAAINGGAAGTVAPWFIDSQTLLFGGETAKGTFLNDTWSFTAGQWTNVTPSPSPSPRAFSSLLLDSQSDTWLFGGLGPGGHVLGDLWDWIPTSLPSAICNGVLTKTQGTVGVWCNVTATYQSSLPSPRWDAAYATDDDGMLYGGIGSHGAVLNDLWQFYGYLGPQVSNMSATLHLNGTSPSPLAGTGLVEPGNLHWGGASLQLFIWGGVGPNQQVLGDSWALSTVSYNNLSFVNDSYFWWVNMTLRYQLDQAPPPLSGISMAYDDADEEVVVFGGYSNEYLQPFNETWTFSNGVWTNDTAWPSPSPRWEASMAYDPALQTIILYGGIGGPEDQGNFYTNQLALTSTAYSDTWAFAAGSWSDITSEVAVNDSALPFFERRGMLGRGGASLAWDPQLDGLLLYGGWIGLSGYCSYSEQKLFLRCSMSGGTWLFTNYSWYRLNVNGPSNRSNAGMVWDFADNYMLLFGGISGDAYGLMGGQPSWAFLADTWKFYNGSWTPLTPTQSPPAVGAPNLVYDENDHYVLLFGAGLPCPLLDDGCEIFPGSTYAPPAVNYTWNETWAFRAGQWTNLTGSLAGAPPRTNQGGMTYDGYDNEVVFLTGEVNTSTIYTSGQGWSTDQSPWQPFDCYPTFGYVNLSVQSLPLTPCWGSTWTYGPPPLRAFAKASVYQGSAPLTIQFTGSAVEGTGPYHYDWNFGDDSPMSTLQNPVHTYNETSEFTVTLKVTDANDTNASVHVLVSTLCPSSGNFVCVVSQYGGYFLHGVSFQNDLGVFAQDNNQTPVSVTGTIGSSTFTFKAPTHAMLSPWHVVLDMGQLPPRSVMDVTATFPGGATMSKNYTLGIVDTPSWLLSFFHSGNPALDKTPIESYTEQPHGGIWHIAQGLYNDAVYAYAESIDFQSMLNAFNVSTGELNFFSGNFSAVPDFGLYVDFLSNGYIVLGAYGAASHGTNVSGPGAPQMFDPDTFDPDLVDKPSQSKTSIDIASVRGSIAVRIDVVGSWLVNATTGGVDWRYFNLTLDLKATLSVIYPLIGQVPPTKDTKGVGVYLTFMVKTNVSLGFIFTPSSSPSNDILPGFAVELKAFLFGIGVTFEVIITAAVTAASLSAGAAVGMSITFELANDHLSVKDFQLTGQLFVTGTILGYGITIFIYNGIIYQWTPNGAIIHHPQITSTAPALLPRYWNFTGYDSPSWFNGTWSGEAIRDVYPYTSLSLAPSSDGAAMLYTTDLVNRSEPVGESVEGYDYSVATNTLSALPAPPSAADQVLLGPRVVNLPNDTLLGLWQSIPPSQLQSGLGGLTNTTLQADYYNTTSGTWSPPFNLTQGGFAQSYVEANCSSGPEVASLEGSSYAGAPSYVDLWSLSASGATLLANRSVSNVTVLDGIDCASDQVAYSYYTGTLGFLNMTSGSMIVVPADTGYSVNALHPVENSTTAYALLEASTTGKRVKIFYPSNGTVVLSRELPTGVSNVRVTELNGLYYAALIYSEGVGAEELSHGLVEQPFDFEGKVIGAWAVEHGSFLVITSLINVGSASHPIVNVGIDDVPLSQVSAPVIVPNPAPYGTTVNLTVAESAPVAVTVNWNGLPAGCTATATGMTCPAPTPGRYYISATLIEPGGNTVTGPTTVLVVSGSLPSGSGAGMSVSRPFTARAEMDAGMSTTLQVVVSGGKGALSYSWSGLPAGCVSVNASSLPCTPSSAGIFLASVRVNDSAAHYATSLPLALVVNTDPSASLSVGPTVPPTAGSAFQIALQLTGGTPSFTAAWTNLPSGCTSTSSYAASCDLSAGNYPVSARVFDSLGLVAYANDTVKVVTASSNSTTKNGPTGGGSSSFPVGLLLLIVSVGVAAALIALAVWRWKPNASGPSPPPPVAPSPSTFPPVPPGPPPPPGSPP